jgi:hypothetical protein
MYVRYTYEAQSVRSIFSFPVLFTKNFLMQHPLPVKRLECQYTLLYRWILESHKQFCLDLESFLIHIKEIKDFDPTFVPAWPHPYPEPRRQNICGIVEPYKKTLFLLMFTLRKWEILGYLMTYFPDSALVSETSTPLWHCVQRTLLMWNQKKKEKKEECEEFLGLKMILQKQPQIINLQNYHGFTTLRELLTVHRTSVHWNKKATVTIAAQLILNGAVMGLLPTSLLNFKIIFDYYKEISQLLFVSLSDFPRDLCQMIEFYCRHPFLDIFSGTFLESTGTKTRTTKNTKIILQETEKKKRELTTLKCSKKLGQIFQSTLISWKCYRNDFR